MTTPASAAPAPIAAKPAMSEPVTGNVLELVLVFAATCVLAFAATCEPGSVGVAVVPPG